jgi:hypothetical protein
MEAPPRGCFRLGLRALAGDVFFTGDTITQLPPFEGYLMCQAKEVTVQRVPSTAYGKHLGMPGFSCLSGFFSMIV